MNDLFLATMVVGAIIAFGALLSVGNERQRRAIDKLHQAYKQWAVQDLRLKRGVASTQTRVEDLTAWLTKTTRFPDCHKGRILNEEGEIEQREDKRAAIEEG